MPKASPAHHNANRIRHPIYSGNLILSAISSRGAVSKTGIRRQEKPEIALRLSPGNWFV